MSDAAKIRTLASRLLRLKPRDANQIALWGLMVGVLYALDRAVELGFADARMNLDPAVECAEHRKTLEAIERGLSLDTPWLGGFYLDSAIMRLSALNERVDIYLGIKHDVAAKIRKVVNQIKHDVDAGIAAGWKIRFADVLKASEDLCGLLEKAIA